MLVSLATESARHDADNEDFVGATPNALVLLDGAGSAGADSGCLHGVAWYSRQLGATLLGELAAPRASTLQHVLRQSIADVTSRHGGCCDITHPGTPSATVLITRVRDGVLEYLVLADSVLVIETTRGVKAISDGREASVGDRYRHALEASPTGSPEHAQALQDYITAMRSHRNQPGGFWVASVEPAAADEALSGEIPASDIRALALLSDGAGRLADPFGLADWPEILRILDEEGPRRLVRQTREAELTDQDRMRWPRGKVHDDATAAYVRI
ncbi:MAG: protein phosphatase 2C domain-containing protein [Pseudonocardia sp.]